MARILIGNAFSLQMVAEFPTSVKIEEVTREAIPETAHSIVGHQDTANVLGVVMNRESVVLEKGDVLFVAQIQGGRLPEGSTTLPEGFSFKFLRVTLE